MGNFENLKRIQDGGKIWLPYLTIQNIRHIRSNHISEVKSPLNVVNGDHQMILVETRPSLDKDRVNIAYNDHKSP